MIPEIMGIVNVTPDSFSDGGKFIDPEKAIAHGLKLLKEGADILDIGGESTRPGSDQITTEEEIARIVPVIRGLRAHATRISVDAYRPEVIAAALDAGATMINDITAMNNPENLTLATAAEVPVCVMHMQGQPKTMQENPVYGDVVEDVFSFLQDSITRCISAGIKKENIVADVGIGFGKTLEHNLALLNNLERFHELGTKILLGASRKSFIAGICPQTPAQERLPGSLASALRGYEAKVRILRVHDVAETRQALAVWGRIKPSCSTVP